MSSGTSQRILGFDGLRGLAAFGVVIHHAAIHHTALGELGVLAFFVLSGYLIIGILHRSRKAIEAGGSATVALGDFWGRRILRICPAYYTALVLVVAVEVGLTRGNELISALPWYLAYLQNFYLAFVRPEWGIFSHTWTLAIEQQFYMASAPLLLFIAARRHTAVLIASALTAFLLCSLLRTGGLGDQALMVLPPYGIVYLAIGGLLVLVGRHIPRAMTGVPAVTVASAFLLYRVLKTRIDKSFSININEELSLALTGIALAVCILHIVRHQSGWIVKILEVRPLRYLGMISYGLYIWHYPIAIIGGPHFNALLQSAGHDPSSARWRLAFFLLVTAASVAVAACSWHLIEKPMLDRKQRWNRMVPAGAAR